MARMVPFPMLPTASSAERRLYEGFLEQLADEYVVYHSVPWNLTPIRPGESRVQGEADFVIAHPVDGLLVLDAPDDEAVTAALVHLGSRGYVRTQTARAFEAAEMEKVVARRRALKGRAVAFRLAVVIAAVGDVRR